MSDVLVEVRRLVQTAANQPFDLETGRLWRAKMVVLGPDDVVLLLTLHHVVWDGWSMDVFIREMGRCIPRLPWGCPRR